MPSEFIIMIAKSGVFAILFVCLLFYILHDARARESKYQSIIDKLADELAIVKDIEIEVKEVSRKIIGTVKLYKEKV